MTTSEAVVAASEILFFIFLCRIRPIIRRPARSNRSRALQIRRENMSDDEETIGNDDLIRWDSEDGIQLSCSGTDSIDSDVDDVQEDDGSISRPPIHLSHLLHDDLSDDQDEDSQSENSQSLCEW